MKEERDNFLLTFNVNKNKKVQKLLIPTGINILYEDGTIEKWHDNRIEICSKNATDEFKKDLKQCCNIDFDKLIKDVDFVKEKE